MFIINLHLHSFLSIKYFYSFFFHQVVPFQWPLGSADKSRNKKSEKTDKIIVADNVQAMHVQDS